MSSWNSNAFLDMPSSPEKSMASRGKKRTGKFLKGRSTVSRTSVKPALSLQEDSSSSVVEMVDEAVQTEVIIPEKPNEEGRADDLLRRMSVIPLDVNLVKELSDMDENTNWVSFCLQQSDSFAHKILNRVENPNLLGQRNLHKNNLWTLNGCSVHLVVRNTLRY